MFHPPLIIKTFYPFSDADVADFTGLNIRYYAQSENLNDTPSSTVNIQHKHRGISIAY